MRSYSIDIYRVGRKGRELTLRLEFPRDRFTNREYKSYLIANLLDLASEGSYYKHLDAVAMCEGRKFLTVRCDTETDGETITARLVAARPREVFRPVRTVLIAS